MKKLAIIGYGQMGKMIEQLAPQYDFEVVSIIDLDSDSSEFLRTADVGIEFTAPGAAYENIKKMVNLKKNIVVGTTGWFDKLEDAKKLVEAQQTGLVYGSNFSLGMNLFYKIVDEATKLMNPIKGYDVFGLECHHNLKKDSPSGTAKILSDIVIKNTDLKNTAVFDKLDRQIEKDEFHFASLRAGSIPGTHLIGFDSEADTIELKHTVRNRTGLAIGALLAARWICDKKGFYNFSDIFSEIAGEKK
ncbi:MAG: 4-hydroxy-tetrahydrodipicolinate reductase [Candidatus Cloacimonadales bacterium]|nr:4-hydroxy-tetrahydrodipicolinate reductase [Candidatus Cloacimonadales bacterium]